LVKEERMKRTLTRKSFLRTGGGVLAGTYLLGLAGCGGGSQGDAALRMTWWGNPERDKNMRRALDLYQQQNAGSTVNEEITPFDAYWDKMATQTAGGNAPSLFFQNTLYLTEYAERGALLDMEQFVPDGIDLSSFDEDIAEQGVLDGKRYAISLGVNAYATLYDTKVLDETGVEIPDAGWTWEDLAEFADAVSQAKGKGFYGTEDVGGRLPLLNAFVLGRGKQVFGEGGGLAFAEEDLADWLTYWYDLRKSGAAPPGQVTAESQEVDQSLIVKGKSPLTFQGSGGFAAYQALTENELELHALPNGPSGSGSFLSGTGVMLSGYSRAEEPEEAAAVVDFLINDPEAIRAIGTINGIPPSSKGRDALSGQLTPTDQKILDLVEFLRPRSSPKSVYDTQAPQGAAEVNVLLGRTNEEVAFGRAKIDEAVDSFFSEAERALS
jgi:multiple sugar transport system substrate-binding protein